VVGALVDLGEGVLVAEGPLEVFALGALLCFGALDALGAVWKDLIMPLLVIAAVLNPVTHTRRIVPRTAMAMNLLRLLNKLLV